jgi:hypothetical protein
MEHADRRHPSGHGMGFNLTELDLQQNLKAQEEHDLATPDMRNLDCIASTKYLGSFSHVDFPYDGLELLGPPGSACPREADVISCMQL